MRYQLVLQWPVSSIEDYDELIRIEDRLLERWSGENEVDGHDFGVAEANIFILTDNPRQAFEEARELLGNDTLWNGVRAAYREVTGNEYALLWPTGGAVFRVA